MNFCAAKHAPPRSNGSPPNSQATIASSQSKTTGALRPNYGVVFVVHVFVIQYTYICSCCCYCLLEFSRIFMITSAHSKQSADRLSKRTRHQTTDRLSKPELEAPKMLLLILLFNFFPLFPLFPPFPRFAVVFSSFFVFFISPYIKSTSEIAYKVAHKCTSQRARQPYHSDE